MSCPFLTHQKPHGDRRSHPGNGTGPNLVFGEIQIGSDLRQQGRNGKPNEKGNKKGPPRAMKGSHVRPGKATQADLSRLVVLVGVRVQLIAAVLFPAAVLVARVDFDDGHGGVC